MRCRFSLDAIQQGRPAVCPRRSRHTLYVVVEGRVRLAVTSEEGRELSFRHAVAGDLFGEIAALDGSPRTRRRDSFDRGDSLCTRAQGVSRSVVCPAGNFRRSDRLPLSTPQGRPAVNWKRSRFIPSKCGSPVFCCSRSATAKRLPASACHWSWVSHRANSRSFWAQAVQRSIRVGRAGEHECHQPYIGSDLL